MDRPFLIGFCLSLICHTALLGLQLIELRASLASKRQRVLDVIYEYQIAERQLRQLESQLTRLTNRASAVPGTTAPAPQMPQIRIPELSALGRSALMPHTYTAQATVVDLSNLVDASQGDPVLLSYFSAIREHIQRTANRHTWLTGEAAEGLVYVSFVLDSTGQVHGASVVTERSASSRLLRDIALRIIKASSPFAPFPPSLSGPSKTVVVPLEFVVGS